MQEFFSVVTSRLAVPLSPNDALAALDDLRTGAVVGTDAGLVRDAAELSITGQLSIWDALVVSAAQRSRCTQLMTEDLNAGQTIEGVLVVNPFLTD